MSIEIYPGGLFTAAASHGLRVFPVQARGKKPAVKSWKQYVDCAPTAEELTAWDRSDHNLGIACGAVSNIVVIDADSESAVEYLDGLGLPPTPSVRTSRGKHYYFRYPGFAVRNNVKVAKREIDVRGDGGYVVGAGSVHESGHRYEWIVGPDDVDFAELPQAILDLLTTKAGSEPSGSVKIDIPKEPGLHRYLAEQLSEACAGISKAEDSTRNSTLNRHAFIMAMHVAAAEVDWAPFASALAEAARTIGLEDREICATLESARAAGFQNPTPLVTVLRDYIYLSGQDKFQHRQSGTLLKRVGFNGSFGHNLPMVRDLASYLLALGYLTKVQDITYVPFEPEGFVVRNGLSYWNTFQPSEVVAQSGDPMPFLEFMEYLIPEDAERDHLMKMMAFTVRNPGQKLRHALLLRSRVHGVGKSLLVDQIWARLLGRHNVSKISSRELTSPFRSWAKGNLMVVVEELNLGAGLQTYNELKEIITDTRVMINEKFLTPREWEVYATFVFISNLEAPILIEGADRRFFVIDTPAEKRESIYYQRFVAWVENNLGVIRNYLDEVDLTAFSHHAPPPMTAAKLALIQRSVSPLAQELAHHIEERTGVFDRDVLSIDQMRTVLSGHAPSDHVIGRALAELGAKNLGQHRSRSGRKSLWTIRNGAYWEFAKPCERALESDTNEPGRFPYWITILPASAWPGEKWLAEEVQG